MGSSLQERISFYDNHQILPSFLFMKNMYALLHFITIMKQHDVKYLGLTTVREPKLAHLLLTIL